MQTVSISELKAHLSQYLKQVRNGSEIQILDRGVPVAKLTNIPAPEVDDAQRRDRLLRTGLLRAGGGDITGPLRAQPISVDASIGEALDEDRQDRL